MTRGRRLVFACASLLAVAACERGDQDGFAVDVTIEADPTAGARIANLSVVVTGDDQFQGTIPAGGKLDSGSAGWIYRPRADAHGRAHFVFVGSDVGGQPVANGSGDADLTPGHTTTARVMLVALAPSGGGGDDMGAPSACAATPPPAGTRTDFYVSAAALRDGSGEPGCPYASITSAITAANLSSAPAKTIHVAAGTYDQGRETFPLILRNGLSLVGEGAAVTKIVGARVYDHRAAGGTLTSPPLPLTLLVGDPVGTQTLGNLTIDSGNVADHLSWGIYCDQGNAYSPTPPVTTPPPNLRIDHVIIGGYDRSIIIGTSDVPPSGCNVAITASQITANGIGVLATGSWSDTGMMNKPYGAIAQIGDGTSAGANHFHDIHNSDPDAGWGHGDHATGIVVYDNTSPLRIDGNVFTDDDVAISLANNDTNVVSEIVGNSFTGMTTNGIQMYGNYHLGQLRDNLFSAINAPSGRTVPTCGSTLASALCVDGYNGSPGPQIDRARNNTFSGNDIGIYVTGTPFTPGVARAFDFGHDKDAGGNKFVCNSSERQPAGYDVWFNVGSSGFTVPFQGNLWDRATPLGGTTGAPDRTDLVVVGGGPTVDVTSAGAHHLPCPAPHDI